MGARSSTGLVEMAAMSLAVIDSSVDEKWDYLW